MPKKEKIYFKNKTSKLWIGILVVSLVFVIIGFFGVIYDTNYKWLPFIGHSMQMLYFLKDFRYKNFVRDHKHTVILKIKSFWWKSISCKKIKAVKLTDKNLIVYRNEQEPLVFDISRIERAGVIALHQLLNSKIKPHNQ